MIISVKNTDICHAKKLVLKNVNFEIEAGEFVYLAGKTGSGKSSLLRTLYADLPVFKGKIEVANYDVSSISDKEIPFLRRKIGIVFQDFQLFTDRNVAENLAFVMEAVGQKDQQKIQNRIEKVLFQVGLENMQNKMPYELSGGEQQRVAIARAMINEPVLILADEPTGNLDSEVANSILELFWELNRTGTTIFMATHQHLFFEKYPAKIFFCEEKELKFVKLV
ncbi:MAG: ATP-binding cassette domain-containing protein [Bacteroidetes bacterium]|nr:MAG: ATP-binding cassette domain-containing protein [Bacteroidota bacterium]